MFNKIMAKVALTAIVMQLFLPFSAGLDIGDNGYPEVTLENLSTHAAPVIAYDFEAETIGTTPTTITVQNGTATVLSHSTEGKGLSTPTANSGNTAIVDLDLIPSLTNYRVTWKDTYESGKGTKGGMILRGFGANSNNPGANQGYLFQTSQANNNARIFTSNGPSGYTTLSTTSLTAPGANTPRWYRATASGSTLTFEYSDDGTNYTEIDTLTDTTYANAGATQYGRGYGSAVDGGYIDDIYYENLDSIPPVVTDSITVDNIDEYQVIQRTGTGADLDISGTYTGTPSSIEASFNGGAFAVIDASPSGGTFSGTLVSQNQGQGTLIVRHSDTTSASGSVDNVGIGDIFIISGQSNASGRGNTTTNTYSHPTLKATIFGNDDTWKDMVDPVDSNAGQIDSVSSDNGKGTPWTQVATAIMAAEGVPVAFVPTAKGGTRTNQWQPSASTSTLYGSMSRRINEVGGTARANLWFQGESNAGNGTTEATYETELGTIVDSISTDFGGLKTIVGQIGHSNNSGNDTIRKAQIDVIDSNANALLGPLTYDINLADESGDTLHFKSDGDIAEFASRWYDAIDEEIYGGADGHGPVLDSANLEYDLSTNKITVPFDETLSGSSSVGTGSFDLENNGSAVSIASLSVTGSTVEITPAAALDTAQNITLSYASLNDGVDAAIYDVNDLPAQPFYNETVNTASSYIAPGGVATNLNLWLKANEGTSSTTDTDPLSSWGDAGNANPYTQGTGSLQPTFRNNLTDNINFNPVVNFDGTDDELAFGQDLLTDGATEYSFLSVYVSEAVDGTIVSSGFQINGPDRGVTFTAGLNAGSIGQHEAVVVSSGNASANNNTSLRSGANSFLMGQVHLASAYKTGTTGVIRRAGEVLPTSGNGLHSTVSMINDDETQIGHAFDPDSDWSPYFNGNIAEVIAYEDTVDGTELQKVESYLALKYGITLSGTGYLNSSGSSVYDSTTGYDKNIFGIAKDDDQALDQRISKSVNSGSILTVSTDSNFTDANTTHADSLTDGQYLVMGINSTSTGTITTDLDTGLYSERIEKEWLVQNTNSVGAVNLKFDGFDDSWILLTDTDGDFSTDSVNAGTLNSDGEILNVTLADDSYFTLAKLPTAPVIAPGGVSSDIALWLKADDNGGVSSDGTTLTSWEDQSINGLDATGENTPTYESDVANTFNFNPVINFDGSTDSFSLTNPLTTGNNPAEMFVVSATDRSVDHNTGEAAISFGQGSGVGNRWLFGYNFFGAGGFRANGGWTNSGFNTGLDVVSLGVPNLLQMNYNTTSGRQLRVNDSLEVSTAATSLNIAGTNAYIGRTNDGGSPSGHLQGSIAEVIVYDAEVSTPTNRQKIESYLALKYGITLDQSTDTDYVSSAGTGTLMWDSSVNTDYNENIFGIGRDDKSVLDQRISNSVNSGSILTVALDNDFTSANTATGRITAFSNDLSFVTFANNTGSLSTVMTELPSGYTDKVEREWQVQIENYAGAINMQFTGFAGYTLLSDADGDFSTGSIDVGTLAANGELLGVTLTDNAYFTLARKSIPIVINEVQYDPIQTGADSAYEWIELKNTGSGSYDLEGWTIGDDDGGGTYTFGSGVLIGSGATLLVVNDTTSFQTNYASVTPDVDMGNILNLSNSGEPITLKDNFGNDVDFVAYDGGDSAWSTLEVDNPGETICRKDVPDTDTVADWQVCTTASPGAENTFNQAPTDIILSGSGAVDENTSTGTTLGTLSTTDPDIADTHTYSFATGTGSTDNASFTLSGSTLVLGTIPDYETQTSYSLLIETNDGNGGTYTEVFTITVNDLDEIAPSTPTLVSISPNPAKDGDTFTAVLSDVEEGTTVTIPGMTCTPNPADATGDVTCEGTVGEEDLDGTNNTITITDPAGNTNTEATTGLTIDNTAPTDPTIGTISPNPAQTGTTVTLPITNVEPGTRVTVPGMSCTPSPTTASGSVTCTAEIGPEFPGTPETITVTDPAGNTNTNTTTPEVTVDDTAPATPTATTNPNPANNGTTITTSLTGVEEGTSVSIPNMTCTPSPADASGEVTCTGTVGTGTGEVSIPNDTITITDPAGNTNTGSTTGLIVDNTGPTDPTIGTISPNPAQTGTTVTLPITNVEPGTTVSIPGMTCTPSPTTASGSVTCTAIVGPEFPGTPETITVTDPAGNTNTNTNTPEVTVDDTAPATPTATTIPNPANNGTTITSTITGVEEGSTVTVTGMTCTPSPADTTGTVTCTGTVGTGGLDGTDTTINVVDPAGNTNTGATTGLMIDNSAPSAPIITGPTSGLPLIGTGEPGATVLAITPSGATCTTTVQPDGNWSCVLSPNPVDGETISATQTDTAGNISSPASSEISSDTDSDNDGISDIIEQQIGTDPTQNDTDNDGTDDSNNDLDNVSPLIELGAANNGDGNNDGILDAIQNEVSSLPNIENTAYNTLAVSSSSSSCGQIQFFASRAVSEFPATDRGFLYGFGLWDFVISCDNPGDTADIQIYLDNEYDTSDWIYRKYNKLTQVYTDISDIVTYTTETVGSTDVTVINYSITDGSIYDEDGTVNGIIVDPSGPGVRQVGGGTGTPGGSSSTTPKTQTTDDVDTNTDNKNTGENVSQEQQELTDDEAKSQQGLEQADSIEEKIDNIEEDTNQTSQETPIQKTVEDGDIYTLENTFASCSIIQDIQDVDYEFATSGKFVDEARFVHNNEIMKFTQIGIVNGYNDGTFGPGIEMTRAEFLKVALKSHCYDYQNKDTSNLLYIDVDQTSWQARVIQKAQTLGMINGDIDENGNSIFRPNDIITKAEALKVLLRISMIQAKEVSPTSYSDIAVDWHKSYIQNAEALGLFDSGDDNYRFNPESGVKREEMIDLVNRLVQLY